MKARSWYYKFEPSAGLLHFSEPEDEIYVKDYWCLLYGYAEPPVGLRVWPCVAERGEFYVSFPGARNSSL